MASDPASAVNVVGSFEPFPRVVDVKPVAGRIVVDASGFRFAPDAGGAAAFGVGVGELIKKPVPSNKKASLQVSTSSAKGTFVLDFTASGDSAVQNRDAVARALQSFVGTARVDGRAGPHIPVSGALGSGIGVQACGDGLAGRISAKLWVEMTSDISKDPTHDDVVLDAARTSVVGGGILGEDEFGAVMRRFRKRSKQSEGEGNNLRPVPSKMEKVGAQTVRSTTEVKVSLNEGQINQLYFEYPSLRGREEEHVQSGRMTREQFFLSFFDFLENANDASEESKNIFHSIFDDDKVLGKREQAKAQRLELLNCCRSIDLTAAEVPSALYGGPRGHGLATGAVSDRQRESWRLRAAAQGVLPAHHDNAMKIQKVNRHQRSVLDTMFDYSLPPAKPPALGSGTALNSSAISAAGSGPGGSGRWKRSFSDFGSTVGGAHLGEGMRGGDETQAKKIRRINLLRSSVLAKASCVSAGVAEAGGHGSSNDITKGATRGQLGVSSNPATGWDRWLIGLDRKGCPANVAGRVGASIDTHVPAHPAGVVDAGAQVTGREDAGRRGKRVARSDESELARLVKELLRCYWSVAGGAGGVGRDSEKASKLQAELCKHRAELEKKSARLAVSDHKADKDCGHQQAASKVQQRAAMAHALQLLAAAMGPSSA